ncbi:putative ABC transporter permease, partial [Patescibacteria group bacterium]|nr:putative ABC transporter permease [Patescibacteria group bacterium]
MLEKFLTGMIIGVIVEFGFVFLLDLFEKKHFRISRSLTIGKEVSMMTIPIWGIIVVLIAYRNPSHLTLFIYSGFVGTLAEFLTGKYFHRLFGIKLWTYRYGNLGEYTSIFSFPYWGGSAFVFISLAKALG